MEYISIGADWGQADLINSNIIVALQTFIHFLCFVLPGVSPCRKAVPGPGMRSLFVYAILLVQHPLVLALTSL